METGNVRAARITSRVARRYRALFAQFLGDVRDFCARRRMPLVQMASDAPAGCEPCATACLQAVLRLSAGFTACKQAVAHNIFHASGQLHFRGGSRRLPSRFSDGNSRARHGGDRLAVGPGAGRRPRPGVVAMGMHHRGGHRLAGRPTPAGAGDRRFHGVSRSVHESASPGAVFRGAMFARGTRRWDKPRPVRLARALESRCRVDSGGRHGSDRAVCAAWRRATRHRRRSFVLSRGLSPYGVGRRAAGDFRADARTAETQSGASPGLGPVGLDEGRKDRHRETGCPPGSRRAWAARPGRCRRV